MQHIRNFSIIAHIDHGKSTLSDCLIRHCKGLEDREMKEQVLDSMDIERERGITIKAQSVSLEYTAQDKKTYMFNFIDTPGHVDFAYEVSRSMKACEGALLVVDASQGVEAQTLANCYAAVAEGLEIIPVINKIDLPSADPERVKLQIKEMVGIDASEAVLVSAKQGTGILELLETIVRKIPPPEVEKNQNGLKALIMDSWFDNYLGVVSLIRVFEGSIEQGKRIKMHSTQKVWRAESLGVFTPKRFAKQKLNQGEVGFLVAGIKNIHGAPVGDTVVDEKFEGESIAGFQKVIPKVFSSLFPSSNEQYENFREALSKYSLNDAAFVFEPESSDALGHGFRCGFLGTLHMEIVQERLEREYDLDLINTAPSVVYTVQSKKGQTMKVHSPSQLPNPSLIECLLEPIVLVNIFSQPDCLGNIINLCIEKRGIQKEIEYLSNQVVLKFEIPMSEIVLDFYDRLKSVSRGYASMDYEFLEYRAADLVKVDIFINGEIVDALSVITHRAESVQNGRKLVEKIKSLIPRQMFEVAIQAGIGQKIIARSNISAMRKNVTAKCYGGDITRKKKLLEKQKSGKKRMRQVGNISIPQEAFMAVLNVKSDTKH